MTSTELKELEVRGNELQKEVSKFVENIKLAVKDIEKEAMFSSIGIYLSTQDPVVAEAIAASGRSAARSAAVPSRVVGRREPNSAKDAG